MAALRFTRFAGLFATGLAALLGSAQASAACSLSFNPGSGSAGDTLTITAGGPGDDLRNTSLVRLGANTATITSVTQTQVKVTVPTKSAPTISTAFTVTPFFGTSSWGTTDGGQLMEVDGANFSASVSVTISGSTNCDATVGNAFTYAGAAVSGVQVGGTAATSVSVFSDNVVRLITPPGLAGVTDVIVIAGTQNSGTEGQNIWAYVKSSPSVNGVGPSFGLTTVSQSVTISGQNFVPGTFSAKAFDSAWRSKPATSVNFPCYQNVSPSLAAGTPSVSGTGSVTLTSPACNTLTMGGVVNVTVNTPAGGSNGSYQWVVPADPTLISVTPSGGSVGPPTTGTTLGGTGVKISGTGFIGTIKVTFGTKDITSGFTVDNAGQISVQTPPQDLPGPVEVHVTVDKGGGNIVTSAQTNVTFNYILPAPVVNTISPPAGSTAGGTPVKIFGQYFASSLTPLTAYATGAKIGGVSVTSFTVVSDTEIDAVTGAHASGTVSVEVTSPSGTTTGAAGNIGAQYTYGTPPPTVISVAPNTGGATGGTAVIITGTYFEGTTNVKFGGAAATGLGTPTCDANHNCTITATTPAHAPGLVDVAVTTSAGTGTGTNIFSYSTSPPTVTAVSPATGSTLGGTLITITGTNFNGTPQVTVGGVAAAQVTVVSPTKITAVTPAGSGAVDVLVTTSFGTSNPNPPGSTFTYAAPVTPPPPPPTVTAVCINGGATCPGFGTTLGLTPVTITGTNFTGATAVTIGGNPATSVVVVNATTITALTPPHAAGAVDVTVTTPGGTSAPLVGGYTYVVAAPTVMAVNPNTGSTVGNSAVTITGTNFTGATAVTFDGIAVGSFTVLTATTIVATTPPHAAGVVNVVVTTPSGNSGATGNGLFTYITQAPPTVTAINPNSGNTAGGLQVTITGTNFGGATSVTIGGNPATLVTVISPTQINATTPAHAPGVVDVAVTTPAGSSGSTGNGLFTYVAGMPTVTAVTPNNGPIAGGTPVTITGTNFNNFTSITIGGVAPTGVTFVNATTITATTPAHAAGVVDVTITTPVGTGNGRNLFTYNAPIVAGGLPVVTAVSPNTGVPGGGTSVTITGSNFTGATAVTFGATASTLFTVVSSTTITARSPVGTGTVHVTVTTALGTSATSAADQFSYVKATTSMDVTSSPNPSTLGQAVTFTARITGANPTGLVTFTENGKVIGTAALANGVATFTIATLAAGSHSVTASYPGDLNNLSDPETVIQVVNAISDSVRLRQMQMAVMPVVTNLSGQAISGAIDNAISAGFGGSCQLVSPNGGGFTYCIDGSTPVQQGNSLAMTENHMLPDQKQMLEEDFKALGYAPEDPSAARRAPVTADPRLWLAWVDFRAADFSRNSVGSDLKGTQLNGTAGITRRITPDFLVGVVGGYEHFDFTSQAYNGKLKGDGYTAGGYVGARLASTVRFDASGAWSAISANDVAGTASGNFTGYRWFASGGVTGTYAWEATVFEPSARVYGLWERENAYTDSLGTLQTAHNFSTGRGSVGLKVSHLFPAGFVTITPYVGLYGDYYFSKDDTTIATTTTTPALTSVPLIQGGAGRATGGVTMMFGGGAQLTVGGEYSGLGQDTRIWNLKLHGSVPF